MPILFLFCSFFLNAQVLKEYYLEIKTGYNLGEIQKTINSDGSISITTNLNDFSNFVNNKEVYDFKKAFSTSITPRLQRVYLIILEEKEPFSDFLLRNEVKNIIALGEHELVGHYPNDYNELLFENPPNSALELIKAPLTWTITKGDPNILVGIADTKLDLNHEDLQGQIVDEILLYGASISHGTSVASMIAAKTDNGKGMASLGYNTKVVSASCNGGSYASLWEGLLQVSQYPGVKVVNCSWRSSYYNQYHELVVDEIDASGVLIVAAAGNSGTYYNYPASYDKTVSVTSVGSRYDIESYDSPNNWWLSWKDCYNGRPYNNTGGHTRNDKVDVTAPGQLILMATDDYYEYPEGYRLGIGTSMAAPIVSALAALIFSVNPNLTAQEVKQIIKSTADDIYHIPYNQQYIGELGTGRINAYRAVKTAECLLYPGGGLDLAMQNSNEDTFVEPDTETEFLWQSNDIWVRNQDDGTIIKVNQNPEYSGTTPSYVYVRVTNNSCVTSTGDDNLRLYWSKANTALTWPNHRNGTLFMQDPITQEDVLMGDEVGVLNIPVLGPGESKILEFEWNVPNPDDYANINTNPWHFCFLARIESLSDPMTVPEGLLTPANVRNNNNIIWKNVTVVDLLPNLTTAIGGVIGIGNPYDTPRAFNLEFKIDDSEVGKPIYEEAEVSLEMDTILYNAWQDGGYSTTYADSTNISNKKIITDNNAKLNNIQFGAHEIGTLNVKFNFLAKELINKKKYTLYVIQRDAVTNELIGGETYIVNKTPRHIFTANAGNDETINKSESITISAAQINEAAIYNWYDPDGNLIYTGTNLTVTPHVTKKYKLEIISDLDGYKDYDEVEVTVNPYHLESLVPNPASNQVTVNYDAEDANSAYLMVVSTTTGISNNYIINTATNSITFDISGYTTGNYSVALVCDGQIQDSKNLLKQ